MSLEWNEVVLTPFAEDQRRTIVTPALRLPSPDWKYATALETMGSANGEVTFAPVSLETLVDSPLDAGINQRSVDLGGWGDGHVRLAMFADTAEQLTASDKTLAKFRTLVTQMRALYVYRHWHDYTFLLTLSDQIPGEGLEHHASSDNGVAGGTIVDVLPDSIAFRAGIAPGAKIVAVNDRALSDGQKQIDNALRAARTGPALRLLIETGSVFRTVTLDDRDGPRYPRLTRVADRPDVLGAIAKALPAP